MTGRLEHEELAELLPACRALVAPSTFPEAFGMVAAEAAACGAVPVVARHSGLAEVAEALAAEVPAQAAGWLTFPVDDGAVEALAERVVGVPAGAARAARRDARRARRGGAAALVVGAGRRGRDRRRAGPPGGAPAAVTAPAARPRGGAARAPSPAPSRPGGPAGQPALRIVFRPPMRSREALQGSRRRLARAGTGRAAGPLGAVLLALAALARRRLRRSQGRRQREPDRGQEGVRREVRLLPHARPRRHQRGRRAEPRQGLRSERPGRARAQLDPRRRRRADQDPEPRRRDAERPRDGLDGQRRRRLRRHRSRRCPARTAACSRPPCSRRAPASRRVEKNGKLTIPASPTGQLAYATNKATATAGPVTIEMPNMSGVDHNLALESGAHEATGPGPVIGQDADHRQGLDERESDAQGRHLHVLLRGPRAPSRGHVRADHGQVAPWSSAAATGSSSRARSRRRTRMRCARCWTRRSSSARSRRAAPGRPTTRSRCSRSSSATGSKTPTASRRSRASRPTPSQTASSSATASRSRNPEGSFVVEQQGYLTTGEDGRIEWMRLVCSGYRPVAPSRAVRALTARAIAGRPDGVSKTAARPGPSCVAQSGVPG